MIKHSSLKQNGFTLIELVIVLGVSTILMLGLFGLFDWHQKVYVQEQATVRTTDAVRAGLQAMAKTVAQSTGIQSSHTINGTNYTTSGNTLVLEVPTVNSSDAIVNATFDYVAFYMNNGKLYQATQASSGSVRGTGTKLLADNVQTFSLTYNNSDVTAASSVSVDIQSSITDRTHTYQTHVLDTFFLRNL